MVKKPRTVEQTLAYVQKCMAKACEKYVFKCEDDAAVRQATEKAVMNQLDKAGADTRRVSLSVEGPFGGEVTIYEHNLYTAVLLRFPEYAGICGALPQEGRVVLPNDVLVEYTVKGGCKIKPPTPAEFITLTFTVGKPDA